MDFPNYKISRDDAKYIVSIAPDKQIELLSIHDLSVNIHNVIPILLQMSIDVHSYEISGFHFELLHNITVFTNLKTVRLEDIHSVNHFDADTADFEQFMIKYQILYNSLDNFRQNHPAFLFAPDGNLDIRVSLKIAEYNNFTLFDWPLDYNKSIVDILEFLSFHGSVFEEINMICFGFYKCNEYDELTPFEVHCTLKECKIIAGGAILFDNITDGQIVVDYVKERLPERFLQKTTNLLLI